MERDEIINKIHQLLMHITSIGLNNKIENMNNDELASYLKWLQEVSEYTGEINK